MSDNEKWYDQLIEAAIQIPDELIEAAIQIPWTIGFLLIFISVILLLVKL